MRHKSELQSDGTSVIYSWVRYEAVIKDLPCLEINNVRVIARHFDKLVATKILDKKVIKDNRGTFTYFRINENTLDKLLSSNTAISYGTQPNFNNEPVNEPVNEPDSEPDSEPPVLESTEEEKNTCNTEGYNKSSVPKHPKIQMTRYWDEKVRQRISGTGTETVR